jgi:hypothetical protein
MKTTKTMISKMANYALIFAVFLIGVYSSNAQIIVPPVGEPLPLGNAFVGAWPADPDFAVFGHLDLDHSLDGNYSLLHHYSGSTYLNAANNKDIMFLINHEKKMALKYNGNFGIGTINPIVKLEVIGKIKGTNMLTESLIAGNIFIGESEGESIIATSNSVKRNWRIGMSATPPFSRVLATNKVQYITYARGSVNNGFAVGSWNGQSSFEIRGGNAGHEAFFRGSVGIGEAPITGTKLSVDGRVYISDNATGVEQGFKELVGNSKYDNYLLWVEEGIVSKDLVIADITEWPDYVFKKDYKLPSLLEVEKTINATGHLHTMPAAEDIEKNGFALSDMTKRLLKTMEELTLHTIAQEKQIDGQKKLLDQQEKIISKLMQRLKKIEQHLQN